jgi:signal transduction histidine kinase
VTTFLDRARRAARRVPALAADSVLTVGLLVLAAYEYAYPGDDGHQAGPLWLNAPLSVLLLLPLVWRRRAPMVTLLIGNAVVVVPSLIVDHTLFAFSGSFVLGIYLYTVARHCELHIARWAPLITLATILIFSIHAPGMLNAGNVIFGTLVYGICWVTGRVLRRYSLTQAALTEALEQLGREHEQNERLAVSRERTRLARDLHDVVAHAVALMLVQAGAARLALDDDTAAARKGLLAVERIGREATGDLRRLLGLLRTEDEDGSLQPAPGLDQLPALIEQVTLAGLEVELETIGEQPALSPSLSTSAYRIVQEALTNVLKHAGPSTVLIRLTYSDPVQIEVIDAGPRTLRGKATANGHGLVGMQERVALFGGSLRAAHQDNGFAVCVELPRPDGLK